MHNGVPLITLLFLDATQLLTDDTLVIKIPPIVEAIDTERWMQFLPQYSGIESAVKHIKLIGNGKKIHGYLRYAFQPMIDAQSDGLYYNNGYEQAMELGEHGLDGGRLDEQFDELRQIEIQNFDGTNIHNIDYLMYGVVSNVNIDISELHLKVLNSASYLQRYKHVNIFSDLLKCGVKFSGLRDLDGLQDSIKSWESDEVIDLNQLGIDLSQVEQLDQTFRGCEKLKKVIGLDKIQHKGIQCEQIFAQCTSLEECPPELQKHRILKGCGAFYSCNSLKRVPKLDIRDSEDCTFMFCGCQQLTEIIIDGARDDIYRNIRCGCFNEIFSRCDGVKSITLRNIRFEDLHVADQAFSNMKGLEEVLVENVTITSKENLGLEKLFQNCKNLKKVTLKNIKVIQKETNCNIQQMFQGCVQLKAVIISNVHIGQKMIAIRLFQGCSNLSNLIIDRLYIEKLMQDTNMFLGCDRLDTSQLHFR